MNHRFSKSEVTGIIQRTLCETIDLSPKAVIAEAEIIRDLGANSLEVIELHLQLEEKFRMKAFSDDELESIRTVDDLIEAIWNRVKSSEE